MKPDTKYPFRIISSATFLAKNYFPSAGSFRERFVRRTESKPIVVPKSNFRGRVESRRHERELGLLERLRKLGPAGESLPDVLKQYKLDGGIVKRHGLITCAKVFRKHHWYDRALEIFDWMEKHGTRDFSSVDHAIRLNLVAIVHGISAAENYFEKLPQLGKNLKTYNVLLHSYCQHHMKDKALTLLEQMEVLNVITPTTFSNLMDLYLKLDQPGMVRTLVDRMKRRKMPLCTQVYKFWMRSCARLNDINGVEVAYSELLRDDERKWHWTNHGELASIFVKAKQFKKAEKALIEVMNKKPKDREAYHFLIKLYAEMGNSDGVFRVWRHVKRSYKLTNTSYLITIQAIDKLNDVEGMKKCLHEWKSFYSFYEYKIPTAVIYSYLRWNRIEDAEREFEEAVGKSPTHLNTARTLFMRFHLKKGDMVMAMKYLEGIYCEEKAPEFRVSMGLRKEFFECLQKEKDVERAEVVWKKLKKVGCLDADAYEDLIKVYLRAAKVAPEMRRRIQEDGIKITPQLQNSLNLVCP